MSIKTTKCHFSGARWLPYKRCLRTGGTKERCLKRMADTACTNSDYKVTKTLRLSLHHTETLLQTIPNLKVVHLFRDPRAVLHSHSNTKWSRTKENNVKSLQKGAQSVCDRIVKDVEYGKILLQKYPKRFTIIQYEDFEQPLQTIKALYEFLGMTFDRTILQYVDSSNGTEKSGNHPFQYRNSMTWKNIQVINRYCTNAFDLLGYRTFTSEKELKDMSISAIIKLSFKIA